MKQILGVLALIAAVTLTAIPVHAQPGPGSRPTENVNVVNTPTVTANIAAVTKKIFDEVFDKDGVSGLIDVTEFKEIRVAARCTTGLCVAGSGSMTITLLMVYGDNIDTDVVRLDELTAGPAGISAIYNLPGQRLRLSVHPSPSSGGRVVVYARAN